MHVQIVKRKLSIELDLPVCLSGQEANFVPENNVICNAVHTMSTYSIISLE